MHKFYFNLSQRKCSIADIIRSFRKVYVYKFMFMYRSMLKVIQTTRYRNDPYLNHETPSWFKLKQLDSKAIHLSRDRSMRMPPAITGWIMTYVLNKTKQNRKGVSDRNTTFPQKKYNGPGGVMVLLWCSSVDARCAHARSFVGGYIKVKS